MKRLEWLRLESLIAGLLDRRRRRRLLARGLTGEFTEPERSDRADGLTRRWQLHMGAS